MQKIETKAMTTKKNYGTPYERRVLLKRGDVKKIAENTGYAYMTIVQQLAGKRKLNPIVKTMADKLADETQAILDDLRNN
jgi:hypothetical protein